MDMFEKATRAAKNLGASIYSTTKEQSELASLNVQKSVVSFSSVSLNTVKLSYFLTNKLTSLFNLIGLIIWIK